MYLFLPSTSQLHMLKPIFICKENKNMIKLLHVLWCPAPIKNKKKTASLLILFTQQPNLTQCTLTFDLTMTHDFPVSSSSAVGCLRPGATRTGTTTDTTTVPRTTSVHWPVQCLLPVVNTRMIWQWVLTTLKFCQYYFISWMVDLLWCSGLCCPGQF